jgi:hypothetical protein
VVPRSPFIGASCLLTIEQVVVSRPLISSLSMPTRSYQRCGCAARCGGTHWPLCALVAPCAFARLLFAPRHRVISDQRAGRCPGCCCGNRLTTGARTSFTSGATWTPTTASMSAAARSNHLSLS